MYKNKTKLRNKIFSLQKNYVWTYTISIFLENETSIKKKYSMFPLSCIYNYLPQKLIKFILLFKKKKRFGILFYMFDMYTELHSSYSMHSVTSVYPHQRSFSPRSYNTIDHTSSINGNIHIHLILSIISLSFIDPERLPTRIARMRVRESDRL